MNFIKNQVSNLISKNPLEFVKYITMGLDPYLEYYSLIRLDNIKDFINNFELNNFISVTGVSGSGKSSFKKIIKNTFDENAKIFEYRCNEITDLDDIFFAFYKFMLKNPQRRELFRNGKTDYKPSSIDEQIIHYIKQAPSNLVIIIDGFEKLFDNTGAIKAENIKSFFEFLATVNTIKVILFSSANVNNTFELPNGTMFETKLYGLDENQIKDFFTLYKIDIPNLLINDIYNKTNGYLFSLKFLALATLILEIPIANILKDADANNLPLNIYIAKKLYSKLSVDCKKILLYIALFRHEVNINTIKTIEHFTNIQECIETLKSYLLIDGDKNFEIKDFLRELIQENVAMKELMYLHEKIADFYADQIPLRPNERVIEISRTSMYSEKFYHYNIFTKYSKNQKLKANKTFTDNKTTEKQQLDSSSIKYIASSQYIPDFPIKQDRLILNDDKDDVALNDKNDDIADISLSDEEKALLARNNISINKSAQSDDDKFDEEFLENFDDLNKFEDNDLHKAQDLLKKGISLYEDGESQESITYLKNATGLLQNKDNTAFYLSKLTLARAYEDNFNYNNAQEQLLELLDYDAPPALKADTYLELASVKENLQEYDEALDIYSTVIEFANENDLKSHLSKVYFKIALLYDDQDDIGNAMYNYLYATSNAIESNDNVILASSYSNIASIYEETNKIDKAIEYYKKSLYIDEISNNYEGQSRTLSTLGNIFYKQNKFNTAIQCFIKETKCARYTEDNYIIASAYLELGDAFMASKDYKNALKSYLLSKKNIDTTISTDSKNKIELRFKNIVDEIGESAYNFLLKEMRTK